MPEPIEKTSGGEARQGSRIAFADMAPLIQRVREFVDARHEDRVVYEAPADLSAFLRTAGFAPSKMGKAEMVLAGDVAVELGHPSTVSRAIVLITSNRELIRHGQITLAGPDLDQMEKGARHPFAQVVMLAHRKGSTPDPFKMENAQYLTNRLPGYMVRSVPGKLWVRISNQGLAAGLGIRTIGSALVAAYMGDFEAIDGVEVIFVTSTQAAVEELAPIATEASILAGRHKKLVLGLDGEVECTELNCETCEEKPVCDNLRDIVIKRRRHIQ